MSPRTARFGATITTSRSWAAAGRPITSPTTPKVAGIMVPTRHRIFPRQPGGEALSEPLLVSIDVSEIAFI
jgi:hypothetical protein